MSSSLRICTTQESGWSPQAVPAALDFHTRGDVLAVELRRWHAGEAVTIDQPRELREEMGAILSGRYELVCGDERYELAAGDGIVIPPGEPRTWRSLSDDGVLYRVSCIGSAPH